MKIAITVSMLLLLQPPWGQETKEQWKARMGTLAEVASELPENKSLGSYTRPAVVSVWYGETRFSHEVHKGNPGKWGSDKGRARCLGQVHESGLVPHARWEKLGGTDKAATRRCAEATLRILGSAHMVCRSRIRGKPTTARRDLARMFGLYGHGSRCVTGKREYERADVTLRLHREAQLAARQKQKKALQARGR
jgi:hypothetical protein